MLPEAMKRVPPDRLPGVFDHSITWEDDVWKHDPFDVVEVHERARRKFRDLLSAVTSTQGQKGSRILLFHGQSGAGKTHLVRALRTEAHLQGTGYFGYAQMTPDVASYADYFLRRLVNSLEKPFDPVERGESGLMRLSDHMLSKATSITPQDIKDLRETVLGDEALSRLVVRIADAVLASPRFSEADVDINIVRALLYLQRTDPTVDQRVRQYLYGREITGFSQLAVGALDPQRNRDPFEIIGCLGTLMRLVDGAALVFCIDQVEDLRSFADAESRFNNAISALIQIANTVPSSIIIVSCLDDFYDEARAYISQSSIDRIEQAGPVPLPGARSAAEAKLIVNRRLERAFEAENLSGMPNGSQLFGANFFDELAGLSTRKLLEHARERWLQLLGDTGRAPQASETAESIMESPDVVSIRRRWESALQTDAPEIPVDERQLLEVLTNALKLTAEELDGAVSIDINIVPPTEDLFAADITVRHTLSGQAQRGRLFVCNRSNQGGGLKKQIEKVVESDSVLPAVLVRGSEFPPEGKTAVAALLNRLAADGGRKIVVAQWEWERMLTLQYFAPCHDREEGFMSWLKAARPMSTDLESIRELLMLDQLEQPYTDNVVHLHQDADRADDGGSGYEAGATGDTLALPAAPQTPAVNDDPHNRFSIAHRAGDPNDPIYLSKNILRRHAAVLGGSGSGKTTLALSIIEQLLLRGVPVVLIDRKGDLASYANPDVWRADAGEDPERTQARRELAEKVDVAVYTPGRTSGRPINITLLPNGIGELPEHEQEMLSNVSAAALGEMLYLRRSATHQRQSGILSVALKILGARSRSEIRLSDLIRFMEEDNEELIELTQRMDASGKARRDLISQLDSLRHRNGALFDGQGEPLSMESLLGLGSFGKRGKTRLSVIYTGFLGDNENVLFRVSQFLSEALRFCQRNPSEALQAVIMFDEADLSIPAQSKPPTKDPLESLLKRARSAGIGLMLATQSPGDLDYRSRDQVTSWFIGRVREDTALKKLRAAFASDSGLDPARVLPNQTVGQFHLIQEGKVHALKAQRNLINAEQVPFDRIEQFARDTNKKSAAQLKLDLGV